MKMAECQARHNKSRPYTVWTRVYFDLIWVLFHPINTCDHDEKDSVTQQQKTAPHCTDTRRFFERCEELEIMTDKPPDWSSNINKKGEFVRTASVFRNSVTADGSSGFPAEADRYHLYVSLACPWAHRTLIIRKLKGLENVISYTVVDWFLGSEGWTFTDSKPKCSLDTLNGCRTLREVYRIASPGYSGKVTVPVLWDKQKKTIVNNESSEIIRILNKEFNAFCATEEQKEIDLYPAPLQDKIDELNGWIYP